MSDLKQAMDFVSSQIEMRKALDIASYKAGMDKYDFPPEIQDAFNAVFETGYDLGGAAAFEGLIETLKDAGAFDE